MERRIRKLQAFRLQLNGKVVRQLHIGEPGQTEPTFMQPGTYGYHCSIRPPSLYPGFVGIVVVKP